MAEVDLTVYYKPGSYLQCNKATTNLFLNTDAPVTQDVILSAGDHTLWMNDTDDLGSVATVHGTATKAAPLTFTSVGETLTCTVAGAANLFVQLETGTVRGPYVKSEGTPGSIGPTTYTFPAVNIHPENASLQIDIEYEGDDTDILDIGAVKLLSVNAGNLILSDGTNSVSTPITAGEHTVTMIIGEGGMSLQLNAETPLTGPYIAFTQADIILSENAYDFTNGERPHDVPSQDYTVQFAASGSDFVYSTAPALGTCIPADYNADPITYLGSLGETTMRFDINLVAGHSSLKASMLGETADLTHDGTGYVGTWPVSIWDALTDRVGIDTTFTVWLIADA